MSDKPSLVLVSQACTVTGQGAGVAAAISIATGTTTSQVNVADVQAELRRQGVKLD